MTYSVDLSETYRVLSRFFNRWVSAMSKISRGVIGKLNEVYVILNDNKCILHSI